MAENEERKYRILIVDDDPDVLSTTTMALEELHQTVETAADGLTALARAEANPPDIVILDLMLPKRGGFQVLQRLKGNRTMRGKRPLVCMITGNEGMRHKEFAERHGVDDYLRKPFAIGHLTDIVRTFIGQLDAGIEDAKPKAK